jgi:transposase
VLSEIARAAGIHVSQLFRWRKELCQMEEPRPETAGTLVPVIVAEAAPTAPRPWLRKRRPYRIPAGSVAM